MRSDEAGQLVIDAVLLDLLAQRDGLKRADHDLACPLGLAIPLGPGLCMP